MFLPPGDWAMLIDGDDAATEDFADMLDELGFADGDGLTIATADTAAQATGAPEPWGAVMPRPTGVLLSPRLSRVGGQ